MALSVTEPIGSAFDRMRRILFDPLGGGFVVIAVPFMAIHFRINQFFVPIMYLRGRGVGDAWAEFKLRLMPELGAVIEFLAQLGGDYERLRGGVDVGGTFD